MGVSIDPSHDEGAISPDDIDDMTQNAIMSLQAQVDLGDVMTWQFAYDNDLGDRNLHSVRYIERLYAPGTTALRRTTRDKSDVGGFVMLGKVIDDCVEDLRSLAFPVNRSSA
jgi:hypothetical protein